MLAVCTIELLEIELLHRLGIFEKHISHHLFGKIFDISFIHKYHGFDYEKLLVGGAGAQVNDFYLQWIWGG